MKWTMLLMVLVCALIAFGGSFECRSSTGDTDIIVTGRS
jgi:hypothetical protein